MLPAVYTEIPTWSLPEPFATLVVIITAVVLLAYFGVTILSYFAGRTARQVDWRKWNYEEMLLCPNCNLPPFTATESAVSCPCCSKTLCPWCIGAHLDKCPKNTVNSVSVESHAAFPQH